MRALTASALAVLPPLALASLLLQSSAEFVQAQPSESRLAVVISDLHLGVGRNDETKEWHPTEDFRWQAELTAFVRAVDRAGQGAADLVLNGDTFELWQSLTDDCQYEDIRLGCTEVEALARLESVLSAHASELAELGAFARAGSNRLVLVPGDHDAALLFPSVAGRAVAALNAPGRVTVATRGYWLSSDGFVYAEHGHQFAADAYRSIGWPEPFIRQDGRIHLERTRGEQLVQGFYNEHELRYPVLDNFSEQSAGLNYAVAADPAAFSVDQIVPILRLLLARMSWQQFRQNMDEGDVVAPEWDLTAVRKGATNFFVESLVPDDPFRAVAERALQEGRLPADLSQFSDQELIAICDYRAAMRRARRRLERSLSQVSATGPNIRECPRVPSTRGDEFEFFWGSRDRRYVSRIEKIRATLQRDGRLAHKARFFVFGHTHLPDFGFVPARTGDAPVVLISSPWQRTATPFQVTQLMDEHGWSVVDMLGHLQPEQLPGCYGVIWIDPEKPLVAPQWVADAVTNDPNPRFRAWREDGRWGGELDRGNAFGVANACLPDREMR